MEAALKGKHAEKIIELNGTFSEICIGFLFLFLFFYFLIHGFACPPFSFFSSLTPHLTPHAIKLYPYLDVYFGPSSQTAGTYLP